MTLRSLSPYRICPTVPADIPHLNSIERSAATRFDDFGLPKTFSSLVTPMDILMASQALGCLWVAVADNHDQVGFVVVGMVGTNAHLEELSVHPAHGRQGLGTALAQTTFDWAIQEGFAAMTLTTLPHIPWNAPFYKRLGFRSLNAGELTPELHSLLVAEQGLGLAPQPRIVMRKDLC